METLNERIANTHRLVSDIEKLRPYANATIYELTIMLNQIAIMTALEQLVRPVSPLLGTR